MFLIVKGNCIDKYKNLQTRKEWKTVVCTWANQGGVYIAFSIAQSSYKYCSFSPSSLDGMLVDSKGPLTFC